METTDKAIEKSAIREIEDGLNRLASGLKAGARASDAAGEILLGDLLTLLEKINTIFEQSIDKSDVVYLPKERIGKLGTGIKSFGFTEAAYTSSLTNPDFVPAYLTIARFKDDVKMCTLLRQLDDTVKNLERSIADTLIYYYDRSYHDALEYYSNVKTAAHNKVHGAQVEYDTLKKYFLRSKSSTTDEPTEQEVLRDARSLLHGTKDGKIVIENARPEIMEGRRKVIDDVHIGRFREKETGSIQIDE